MSDGWPTWQPSNAQRGPGGDVSSTAQATSTECEAAADLLIAATATSLGGQVMTTNARHYPMFEDLAPPY